MEKVLSSVIVLAPALLESTAVSVLVVPAGPPADQFPDVFQLPLLAVQVIIAACAMGAPASTAAAASARARPNRAVLPCTFPRLSPFFFPHVIIILPMLSSHFLRATISHG